MLFHRHFYLLHVVGKMKSSLVESRGQSNLYYLIFWGNILKLKQIIK